MHKYEDYIDIVDGDEMKEDEIDCIVCGALENLKHTMKMIMKL